MNTGEPEGYCAASLVIIRCSERTPCHSAKRINAWPPGTARSPFPTENNHRYREPTPTRTARQMPLHEPPDSVIMDIRPPPDRSYARRPPQMSPLRETFYVKKPAPPSKTPVSGDGSARGPHAAEKMGGWFRLRLPPWPVLAAATAVLVYLLAAYLLAHGHELPRWVQLLTGLGFVALAIAAFVVITRARELPGDMLRRLARRNTPDFGKQLRTAQNELPRSVRLPLVGETSFRVLGGALLAFAAAVGWMSPLGPIRVRRVQIVDLTICLGDEIVATVLVLPNPHMAIAAPPLLPPPAAELARQIPANSGYYNAALKAMGEGRFGDARPLLVSALHEGEEGRVRIAQAQVEMFTARYGEAADFYRAAGEHDHDDPKLLCQLAVAQIQAGHLAEAQWRGRSGQQALRKQGGNGRPARGRLPARAGRARPAARQGPGRSHLHHPRRLRHLAARAGRSGSGRGRQLQ